MWFHKLYEREIEVEWDGMTDEEERDLAAWSKERNERLLEQRKVRAEEHVARKASLIRTNESDYEVESRMGMYAHYRMVVACRADCGEQSPTFVCPKCKFTREISLSLFAPLMF